MTAEEVRNLQFEGEPKKQLDSIYAQLKKHVESGDLNRSLVLNIVKFLPYVREKLEESLFSIDYQPYSNNPYTLNW